MSEDSSILTRTASRPDSTIHYGSDLDQIADVRFGEAGAARHPLVLLLHGGYWRPAYDRTHMAPMAVGIAALGWTVANIEYRRVPGNAQATIDDVAAALELLPARIGQHNGRVLVAGFSAGGHLALWFAQSRADPAFTRILALAPVADLVLADQNRLGDGAVQAFIGESSDTLASIDPRQLPDASMPVTIVHGTADEVVPIELSESYLAAHRETRLHRLPAGHFALVDPAAPAWPMVLEELRRLSDS